MVVLSSTIVVLVLCMPFQIGREKMGAKEAKAHVVLDKRDRAMYVAIESLDRLGASNHPRWLASNRNFLSALQHLTYSIVQPDGSSQAQ